MPFAHRLAFEDALDGSSESVPLWPCVNPHHRGFAHRAPAAYTAFTEADGKVAGENAGKAVRAAEGEPPTSEAAKLDAMTAQEKADVEEPVANIEVSSESAPDSFEPDSMYDPRVPRMLDDGFVLEKHGAWDMRPFGLRVNNKRLLACDSDSDNILAEGGKCGVIGTASQLDGISFFNKVTGTRTFPVKRYDEIRMRWTAEDAPYITIPEWKLPRDGHGRVDFAKIPLIPKSMTLESPGRLPLPIEGSTGLLPCCLAVAAPMNHSRRDVQRRSAACDKERCMDFLCPINPV